MTLDHLERLKCLKRGISGINLDPLQRGGILTPEARDALMEWGDGYSVCDFCNGEIDRIRNPPIEDFVHGLLPEFLGIDEVRITHGAREGMYAAMHAICRPGDVVVVDGNAHYTAILAAERAGLEVEYVPASGAPDYQVMPAGYADAFQRVKDRGGRIGMALLTYPDGNYGNIVDPREVSAFCHEEEEEVPFLLNGAYSIGRMPLNARDLGVDIIVGSGHKSMASCGPIGVLGACGSYAKRIFAKSALKKNKELEFLGCTARGAGLITMMASFSHVVERIGRWDEEAKKAEAFCSAFEGLGIVPQGDRPHRHDLIFFEAEVLYEISKKAKKGRYFLYRDLKARGICGIKAGLTRRFKLSTYMLKEKEIEAVIDAFADIIDSHRG